METVWTDKAFWSAFIRFGGSKELLFIILGLVMFILLWGFAQPRRLAAISETIDCWSSKMGKTISWFALLMVVQQILIVFMQAIFKQSTMSFGPFLFELGATPQWFSEQLRLYNAFLIILCAAFTMVEGGHVRVDLIYCKFSHRAKRIADLIGVSLFLIPFVVVVWYFSWFYMWRSISNVSVNLARDSIKFRSWKLELSSNPSGFDDIYLFKILIPIFALVMFLQAISIIYRSVAALRDRNYLDSLP